MTVWLTSTVSELSFPTNHSLVLKGRWRGRKQTNRICSDQYMNSWNQPDRLVPQYHILMVYRWYDQCRKAFQPKQAVWRLNLYPAQSGRWHLVHSWKCGRYSGLHLWHRWLYIRINPTKPQAPLHPKWTFSTSPSASVSPTRQPWYEKKLRTFHYVWVQNTICSVFMWYLNWSPGLKTCYVFIHWHIAFTWTLPPKTKGNLSNKRHMDNVLSL